MVIDPNTGKVRLEGWAQGVDNRSDDHNIADNRLRDAVNVDILSTGKIRSRNGITQRVGSPGAHSVFANALYMVWATANALYVSTDGLTGVQVRLSSLLNRPLSYVDVNGEIYWSNERINGKINIDGDYELWGIAIPASDPVLLGTPVETGFLPREYQVTCTFVLASGEESGARNGVKVICGDDPLIAVYSIPQSADSRVIATRIYVTNIDGQIFYANQDVPAGVTSTVLSGFFANGAQLKTQDCEPPPPGQLLDYHKGKIYIAADNVVWETEALRYGAVNRVSGFFMYSERVTMLKAVTDGFYVAADKTYFVSESQQMKSNQPQAEVEQIVVFPHRAVEGAACNLPNTTDVVWFGDRGFARATDGGKAQLLTENQLAVDSYTYGTMAYSHINGHESVIAMLQGGVANAEINADFLAGEVTRLSELQ